MDISGAGAGATASNIRNVARKGGSSFILNGSIAIANINSGHGASASVSLWARNVLDETYVYRVSVANRNTLGDYGNLNPTRTFGVSLNLDF